MPLAPIDKQVEEQGLREFLEFFIAIRTGLLEDLTAIGDLLPNGGLTAVVNFVKYYIQNYYDFKPNTSAKKLIQGALYVPASIGELIKVVGDFGIRNPMDSGRVIVMINNIRKLPPNATPEMVLKAIGIETKELEQMYKNGSIATLITKLNNSLFAKLIQINNFVGAKNRLEFLSTPDNLYILFMQLSMLVQNLNIKPTHNTPPEIEQLHAILQKDVKEEDLTPGKRQIPEEHLQKIADAVLSTKVPADVKIGVAGVAYILPALQILSKAFLPLVITESFKTSCNSLNQFQPTMDATIQQLLVPLSPFASIEYPLSPVFLEELFDIDQEFNDQLNDETRAKIEAEHAKQLAAKINKNLAMIEVTAADGKKLSPEEILALYTKNCPAAELAKYKAVVKTDLFLDIIFDQDKLLEHGLIPFRIESINKNVYLEIVNFLIKQYIQGAAVSLFVEKVLEPDLIKDEKAAKTAIAQKDAEPKPTPEQFAEIITTANIYGLSLDKLNQAYARNIHNVIDRHIKNFCENIFDPALEEKDPSKRQAKFAAIIKQLNDKIKELQEFAKKYHFNPAIVEQAEARLATLVAQEAEGQAAAIKELEQIVTTSAVGPEKAQRHANNVINKYYGNICNQIIEAEAAKLSSMKNKNSSEKLKLFIKLKNSLSSQAVELHSIKLCMDPNAKLEDSVKDILKNSMHNQTIFTAYIAYLKDFAQQHLLNKKPATYQAELQVCNEFKRLRDAEFKDFLERATPSDSDFNSGLNHVIESFIDTRVAAITATLNKELLDAPDNKKVQVLTDFDAKNSARIAELNNLAKTIGLSSTDDYASMMIKKIQSNAIDELRNDFISKKFELPKDIDSMSIDNLFKLMQSFNDIVTANANQWEALAVYLGIDKIAYVDELRNNSTIRSLKHKILGKIKPEPGLKINTNGDIIDLKTHTDHLQKLYNTLLQKKPGITKYNFRKDWVQRYYYSHLITDGDTPSINYKEIRRSFAAIKRSSPESFATEVAPLLKLLQHLHGFLESNHELNLLIKEIQYHIHASAKKSAPQLHDQDVEDVVVDIAIDPVQVAQNVQQYFQTKAQTEFNQAAPADTAATQKLIDEFDEKKRLRDLQLQNISKAAEPAPVADQSVPEKQQNEQQASSPQSKGISRLIAKAFTKAAQSSEQEPMAKSAGENIQAEEQLDFETEAEKFISDPVKNIGIDQWQKYQKQQLQKIGIYEQIIVDLNQQATEIPKQIALLDEQIANKNAAAEKLKQDAEAVKEDEENTESELNATVLIPPAEPEDITALAAKINGINLDDLSAKAKHARLIAPFKRIIGVFVTIITACVLAGIPSIKRFWQQATAVQPPLKRTAKLMHVFERMGTLGAFAKDTVLTTAANLQTAIEAETAYKQGQERVRQTETDNLALVQQKDAVPAALAALKQKQEVRAAAIVSADKEIHVLKEQKAAAELKLKYISTELNTCTAEIAKITTELGPINQLIEINNNIQAQFTTLLELVENHQKARQPVQEASSSSASSPATATTVVRSYGSKRNSTEQSNTAASTNTDTATATATTTPSGNKLKDWLNKMRKK